MRERIKARVARGEWSGLSSLDIDVSPQNIGAARPYQSVEVISRVERTAVRRSLQRMVRRHGFICSGTIYHRVSFPSSHAPLTAEASIE